MSNERDTVKFHKEQDFCEYVMPCILGLWEKDIGNLQVIAEAPKNFFSNDHVDILVINRKDKDLFAIEFKLSDYKGLQRQVDMTRDKLATIGIINRPMPKVKTYGRIYGFTGEDYETERIADHLSKKESYIHILHCPFGMAYWWGYMGVESNLSGGKGRNTKRPTFHHLYVSAIKNLQKHYDCKLQPLEVAAILGCYEYDTFMKHYRTAMSN